jgi:hypothetical protein
VLIRAKTYLLTEVVLSSSFEVCRSGIVLECNLVLSNPVLHYSEVSHIDVSLDWRLSEGIGIRGKRTG